MIKSIVTSRNELAKRCTPIAYQISHEKSQDLLDTANSLYNECSGLAANQIGYNTCIIAVKLSSGFEIMVNPEYLEKSGKLKNGKEGCLSHPETIKNPINVKRWYKIKIKYTDINGDVRIRKFKNFFARVIQHEMDHLEGILI